MGNLENAMKMPFFSRKKRMFVTMMIGISRSDRSVRLKGEPRIGGPCLASTEAFPAEDGRS